MRSKQTIYRTEFDGREKLAVPRQSNQEMADEAAKIEATWPHGTGK